MDDFPLGLNGSSYEDNPVAAYFFNALFILATAFSLTLLYPLAYCLREKRKAAYTYIMGRKLTFTGKISAAYFIYLTGFFLSGFLISLVKIILREIPIPERFLNAILSAVTASLSLFFTKTALLRWKINNLSYLYSSQTAVLKRNLPKCIAVSIVTSILGLVTLGISYPFIYKLKESYYVGAMSFGGDDLKIAGGLRSLCLYFYAGLIFSAVTFGLFVPALMYLMDRWKAENTVIRPL